MSTTNRVQEPGELTGRQREVFEFLWSYTLEHGYQPSYREIMEAFGASSTNGVACHIRALCRKGWVGLVGGRPGKAGRTDKSRVRAFNLLRKPDGSPFEGLAFA